VVEGEPREAEALRVEPTEGARGKSTTLMESLAKDDLEGVEMGVEVTVVTVVG
jgi:hypothetical protein